MNISTTTGSAVKRHKNHHHHGHDHQSLIPGLPDHIAQICLNLVNPSTLFSVCHSWRRLIYSPSFPPFLCIYALLTCSETIHEEKTITTTTTNSQNSVEIASFDPILSKWCPLPPLPGPPPCFLVRHPSFISRNIPVQSVSVSGKLVLVAATNSEFSPAIDRPLVFDPARRRWSSGPGLAHPRRWCAAGALGGKVYVASGVGSHYNPEVARSVVKWDPLHAKMSWVEMGGLKDSKFSREAIDAIGWRGKLCMVNVKGDAAKEGLIYDVGTEEWEEMPEGMLMGWRGPAAAIEEETIYVVDESRGALRKYDDRRDTWVEVVEDEMLKGATQVAAAGGRVCVVGGGDGRITVVDVAVQPARLVVVETPVGFQVLNIHVLPRMSQQGEDY